MKNFDPQNISLPEEFASRMKALLGDEFSDFLESYKKPLRHALRINTLKTDPNEALSLLAGGMTDGESLFSPVPWDENGFYYEDGLRPGKSPFHVAGLYYIQEPSAMRVAGAVDARPGEKILDLCAAPGGKTTAVAASMNGEGLLLSNEIHPARAKALSQNVERMGISNCVVTNSAPSGLSARFPCFFDKVLVDAPCSGEGMFRKEPDALACWSEENIHMCAQRQREILRHADAMLMPGGKLIYSTCTFAPEENELQIRGFLEENPDYELLFEEHLYPHKVDGEGHFVAVLKKAGNGFDSSVRPRKDPPIDRSMRGAWNDFCDKFLNNTALSGLDKAQHLTAFGHNLYLMPEPLDLSGLKCLRPGLHLGTAEKGRFVPAHALALALKQDEASYSFDLSVEDAAKYIFGLTFPCDPSLSGWILITVRGKSLSWGKASGGILKNHYPKGLRHS